MGKNNSIFTSLRYIFSFFILRAYGSLFAVVPYVVVRVLYCTYERS